MRFHVRKFFEDFRQFLAVTGKEVESLAKVVILVKTGIQLLTNPGNFWIPACAGMTVTGL